MAKKAKDLPEVEEQDLYEVDLGSRVLTFRGEHLTGVVELPEDDAQMVKSQLALAEKEDKDTVRRADRSITGVRFKNAQGTDPYTDHPSREDTDEATFGEDDTPASQLFGKDDDELKDDFGLSKKEIKKLRRLETEAEDKEAEAEAEAPKKSKKKKSKRSKASRDDGGDDDSVMGGAEEEERTDEQSEE